MEEITIGTRVPSLTLPPVSRTALALYAGASGDHNPIHIDSDAAQQAGMPDVFAHGMLSMAYLGRMLTNWVPQGQLRKFSSRFVAITQVHDVITCSGVVTAIHDHDDQRCATVEIKAENQDGTATLVGVAEVIL
jgi:acyl dehydratase